MHDEGAFDRTIVVPYPPESPASGIGDRGLHPVLWYRRTFAVGDGDRAQRLVLHFGAVDHRAEVWVNGHGVGQHEGGHTPFAVEITHALVPGDEQVVVVRAEDRPEDITQPRGKQYWGLEPEQIWYHRTSGIWQTVWLERVPLDFIDQIRWTTDLDRDRLTVGVRTNRPVRGRIAVRLTHHGEVVVDDVLSLDGTEVTREIGLQLGPPSMVRTRRWVWSPEYPNLLDAEVSLILDDEVVDRVTSYVGLRSVSVSDGRLILNGRPYYMRLVLSQGYWPQTHLTPPDDAALRTEVESIKALGFNGVRMHQKVEDPRFLYWADRLGVLVWGETANAFAFTPEAVRRLTTEWLDVVHRDLSHPCIVTWVPLNESWGVHDIATDPAQQAYATGLAALTRAVDPSRPVISNDGWEHTDSDLWTVHDYADTGAALTQRYGAADVRETLAQPGPAGRVIRLPGGTERGQPLMLTEFGGVRFTPDQSDEEGTWGYSTASDA